MNVTKFIQLLKDIKDEDLNSKYKTEVEEHLNNLKSKPIAEDKLNDAMNFVKGHVVKNDLIFPAKFGSKSADFMGLGAHDLIKKENEKQFGNNPHAMFPPPPQPKNPKDRGWELSICEQVLLAFFPVVGWSVLFAYAIYRNCIFTEDNGVPAGPVPNK